MRNNVSDPLDWACAGRILPERNMRPHLVIINGIFRKDSAKVIRVERDQMIGALAPDRPDQAFSISVLPGRADRGGPGHVRSPFRVEDTETTIVLET
jgi:hypothetical protein